MITISFGLITFPFLISCFSFLRNELYLIIVFLNFKKHFLKMGQNWETTKSSFSCLCFYFYFNIPTSNYSLFLMYWYQTPMITNFLMSSDPMKQYFLLTFSFFFFKNLFFHYISLIYIHMYVTFNC